jgi:hypothetical protein
MIHILKYIWVLIKHKMFVLLIGVRLRVPFWQLLTHDLSKLSWKELPHYGKQFFGHGDDPVGFACAWNHPQKSNPHHWEYWVMISGYSKGGFQDNDPLPMPDKYIKEMVADWFGASRAYSGKWPKSLETWEWFRANFKHIRLHPVTRRECLALINKLLGDN